MVHIHWLGAGLSSLPGIRRMASSNYKLTIWNRTLAKAEFSINHVKSDNVTAKELDLLLLSKSLKTGDIVVSQLSANMHTEIAKICLEKNCHFASSSYISSSLKKLDQYFINSWKTIKSGQFDLVKQSSLNVSSRYHSRNDFEKLIARLNMGYDTKLIDLSVIGIIINSNLNQKKKLKDFIETNRNVKKYG